MPRSMHVGWVCALGAVFLLGCSEDGPTTVNVTGDVTFDGAPLPDGDLIFVSPDNTSQPTMAKVKNGKYEAKVTPGKKKVQIRATRMEKLPTGQKGAMGETEAPKDYIPAKYNDSTELQADPAQGGENKFNFALSSK